MRIQENNEIVRRYAKSLLREAGAQVPNIPVVQNRRPGMGTHSGGSLPPAPQMQEQPSSLPPAPQQQQANAATHSIEQVQALIKNLTDMINTNWNNIDPNTQNNIYNTLYQLSNG